VQPRSPYWRPGRRSDRQLTAAAEGRLQRDVQLGEGAVAADEQPRQISGLTRRRMARFVAQDMPLGRFGRAEEVGGDMVAFLCLESASLVTGACIPVDGFRSRSVILRLPPAGGAYCGRLPSRCSAYWLYELSIA
jgi:Enoyl-(Acyl carrier protein) reductase